MENGKGMKASDCMCRDASVRKPSLGKGEFGYLGHFAQPMNVERGHNDVKRRKTIGEEITYPGAAKGENESAVHEYEESRSRASSDDDSEAPAGRPEIERAYEAMLKRKGAPRR